GSSPSSPIVPLKAPPSIERGALIFPASHQSDRVVDCTKSGGEPRAVGGGARSASRQVPHRPLYRRNAPHNGAGLFRSLVSAKLCLGISGRCSSAHRQMALRGRSKVLPSGDSRYSTWGGTTAQTFL